MTATVPSALPESGAELDPESDALIEESRAREASGPARRELAASALIGLSFLVAAGVAAALVPTHRAPSVPVYLALIAAYALASRVGFEIGSCWALPTTLVLTPMLFVLPLRAVPLCVAAALIVRDLPEWFTERTVQPNRVFIRLLSSWHALGPVLVLAAVGERSPRLGDLPWYVAALAAQFGLDFASAAAREWLALGISPLVVLRFSAWAWLVDLALAPVGIAVAVAAQGNDYGALLAAPLVGLLSYFARERTTRIDHALELSHAYRGTALLLGDVVEADDAYTGSHSRDVVDLVLTVCDELGLSAKERRDAEFVALLHDVGKIRIPAEIINKPGPLTDEERAIINTHTIIGEQLLGQVGGLLGQVGRIVRSCHERWDGGGYPDGLAGEAIPRIARIVCACDAYSAITTTRPYRAARTPAEALEELHRSAGTHFDPEVVEAMARVLSAT